MATLINRVKVNILAPYNTKRIVDEQVLTLLQQAKDLGGRIVGEFSGWSEHPTDPPVEGHLVYVLKAHYEPNESVNHIRWLSDKQALCDEPKRTDFVLVDYDFEKSHCLECTMRLRALNSQAIS